MIIGGTHTQYLAAALRGLDAQRQAHEHNIANVETPGFQARQVSFEDSLRRAMATEDLRSFSVTTRQSLLPTRIDGNNVRLDDEITGLELNGLQQRLVTEAVNDQFARIRSAIGR